MSPHTLKVFISGRLQLGPASSWPLASTAASVKSLPQRDENKVAGGEA